MKKIILYGIANREIRVKIQSYISEHCKLIGISDSIHTEDYLQGMKYIYPDDIVNYSFDYIIIQAEKENTQKEIVEMLQRKGIKRDKIVVPRLFCVPGIDFIPDLKKDLLNEIETKKQADSICLGLSYSLRGIDFNKLCLECIDCSWHGLDLYYCYKIAECFQKKRFKTTLLVFPYYYFNYDMSLSEYQFNTGQIMACRGFEDWHNANYSHNSTIRDYLASMEFFGKKFWENRIWKREIPKNENVIEYVKEELPQVWKKNYKKTIEENKDIFELLVKKLRHMRIILIIPPIFLGGGEGKREIIYYTTERTFL